jgi:NADH:ubiquinone oxidoreductase subunit F (NADH-binding)
MFSVSGHVEQARQLRTAAGHSVHASCSKWPAACASGRKLKAVIPGGSSVPGRAGRDDAWAPTMDYDSLAQGRVDRWVPAPSS